MKAPQYIPLPGFRYLPGTGSEPDMAPLELAKSRAHEVTRAGDWAENDAYTYGHALFNHGFYWEAHEVWEAVWMAAPANSAERVMLQFLIQKTNAALKRSMQREQAAARLDARVDELRRELIARLGDGRAEFMGVELADPVWQSSASR